MKKWISYILLSALLITAIPSFVSEAAETSCTGKLTANGTNIDVSLSVPQAATENITSLHFRVNVSIETGKMDTPSFQFADNIKSEVQDGKVINGSTDNSSYIVDVVLSGKKDKIIFPENGQAGIGTISLKPSGNVYKISANFTGINADNNVPSVEYVTDNGQLAQEVSLVNTEIVTIEQKAGQNQPSISIGSYVPSATITPGASASPSATAAPDTLAPGVTISPSPSPAGTSTPGITNAPGDNVSPAPTEEPGSTNEPSVPGETVIFNTQTKPSISASIAKGSCNVKLKWNKIEGADGYIIYSSSGKAGSYKKLETILNPDKISYNAKMNYASSYLFRIRAFKTSEDGSRVFGKYSNTAKVTTAPAKVKGFKAKVSGSKINLSWKKVKNADGYRIYSSKKKNGSYSAVKTLKKGSVSKTTIKNNKKTAYYKIRAYVKNVNGQRVYGKVCTGIKAKS